MMKKTLSKKLGQSSQKAGQQSQIMGLPFMWLYLCRWAGS